MAAIKTREHFIDVPLNYSKPSAGTLKIFAREIFLAKNAQAPIFLYQQGGPGFASPRNFADLEWCSEILKKYRLVLLDQRGTGRSSKIGPELAKRIKDPRALAEYFTNFRADNIVRDSEFLREQVFKVSKWFLLGQSFGGFVSCHYLSFYPDSLAGVIITGGLPPLTVRDPLNVYRKLVRGILKRNEEFRKLHPPVKTKLQTITRALAKHPVQLGDGSSLTPQRFLDIGILLGREKEFPKLMQLLDDPFIDHSESRIAWEFAKRITQLTAYETNPIYAVLHESIYCEEVASEWAADRALAEHGSFQQHENFFGETIRKSMFSEYAGLRVFREAAQLLSKKSDWPKLYDRKQLKNNRVPVECLIYKKDFYVDYEFSLQALKKIRNAKAWIQPTWHHDGLREHGKVVISKLMERLRKRLTHAV